MNGDSVWAAAGRWAFTSAWTAAVLGGALTRHRVLGDPEAVRSSSRVWSRGMARGWGMEVQVHGAEHVDPRGIYVFMANHQSYADVVALFEALPVLPGFLAKRELRAVPIIGAAIEAAGHVFIDRGHRAEAHRAIERAAEQVRAGRSIVIFPEGTRSAEDRIRPFKRGGFHLAKQAAVPIVPVGIRGARDVLPKRGFRIQPGVVQVHIGAPVPIERVAAEEVAALAEHVRAAVADLSGLPMSAAG